jgi:hypothetical protein
MRHCLTVAIVLLTLSTAPCLSAQGDKPGKKPATAPTAREILASLQTEIPTADLKKQAPSLGDLLQKRIPDALKLDDREITFSVDDAAYREEVPELASIQESELRNLQNLPPRMTINQLLRHVLKQLPVPSAFVVRAGRVDIVPLSHTSKDHMLNQTFYVEFKDRPLAQALDELSELTGVSIVVDARAKERAQTPVSARFHDDVALQDAVRMLTDMSELKLVYLVTGIYVTTPERSTVMQKELKQLYEGPEPAPGQAPLLDPLSSPLVPPLPPRLRKAEAGV